MEAWGNEETFCVTLNNKELTSLDKFLLGSPIYIVIPASQKFYLWLISIIIHTFGSMEIWRTLLLAMWSRSDWEPLYQTAVLCISKGCWWELSNVHLVEPRFWTIQQQTTEWWEMLPFYVAGWLEGTLGWKQGIVRYFGKSFKLSYEILFLNNHAILAILARTRNMKTFTKLWYK